MSEEKNSFLDSRPQSLCLMCGKCCRVATTPIPYQELKQLAKDGDEGAIDFLDIFEPYPSVEEARKADAKTVDNIILAIETDDIHTKNNITFYKCKHILENNLCGIYKNRKELCDRFPSSPWAIVPPDCGFKEWLGEKREQIKVLVRKQKENLKIAESLLPEAVNPQQEERIQSTIEKIKRTIEFYSKYGSKDW